jgi:UDP-N-acetylmuramate--L-alanine ligase
MINLENVNKIYFVGIGGIAMSAVASIAKSFEYEVSGSDSKEVYSPAKDVLRNSEINFNLGYDKSNIENAKADLYILSAGEGPENPEVEYILDNDLPRGGFAELLFKFSEEKLRIVVAGTHGKSTTTGLLGYVFKSLDDSSFVAGGVLRNLESNFYLGDGHYFIFEGDEYKSEFDDPTPKFNYYNPDILVLTNLEYDHPDVFESLEALEEEFRILIEKLPPDAIIVYNADNASISRLVHESNIASVSFGIDNEADFKVEQIQYSADFTTIEVMNKLSKTISSKLLGQTEQYKTQLPGKINVYNSLAAIATLRALGFAQENIALDLLSYQGVKRRFEVVGVKNGITLVDDYAHHPTAVKETLDAARLKYSSKKIWAVFEPHTFSRTEATLAELANSFESADEVLISEIYPAREKKSNATIKSEAVVEAIGLHHKHIRQVKDKADALDILKAEASGGDVIIVMAVGNFNRLVYELKEVL